MDGRRVAITGIGAASPLGIGAARLWAGLLEGRCGLGPIRAFDAAGFACRIAGQVPQYNIRDYVPKSHRKATKMMCRDIELVTIASKEALDCAGQITKADDGKEATLVPHRTAVNFGAGFISCDLTEMAASVGQSLTDGRFDIRKWGASGMETLTPLWLLKYLPNMLSCHVAIIHDIQGPSNTITAGEVGSYLAVTEAAEMIVRGDVDTALAGGGDCRVSPLGILRPVLMGRVNCQSNDNPAAACRPFDKGAGGSIFSEAAGVLVLEDMEQAKRRGAKILAEVAGGGSSHSLNRDYFHLEPDGAAVRYAIEAALNEAKLNASELDLIIPCGSAIALDDAAEARGIEAALGDAVGNIPVWPIKSMIGHSGAASGSLELIAAACAISNGRCGGALNFTELAKGCGLNLIKDGFKGPIDTVLCCGYSFGGQTAAVVLKRVKG